MKKMYTRVPPYLLSYFLNLLGGDGNVQICFKQTNCPCSELALLTAGQTLYRLMGIPPWVRC